jgi:hypothetical protein
MRPFVRGVAADNPHVTTVDSEILTPAGRRWVERVQRPLDVLAVIFLIDVILIWSFPDAPPAFLQTLNVIVLFVWACFAVDYVARLMLSVQKGRFVRTHKLDLLMVLLPMLRLLRVVLLLRRSLASVSTERIAGSIVSLVVAAMFVSAFLMWRVEHNAPGAPSPPSAMRSGGPSKPPRQWATATTHRSRPPAASSPRPSWSWASD